jgi:hypothetical protein
MAPIVTQRLIVKWRKKTGNGLQFDSERSDTSDQKINRDGALQQFFAL